MNPRPTPAQAAMLQQAIALHRAGNVADAERLYDAVLREDPACFDALHLAGVTAFQTGNATRGAELIARALAVDPSVADAHCNLGYALRALGRHAEALASFETALALKPGDAVMLNNRAVALCEVGRADEALADFNRAIAARPGYAEAHNNHGNALAMLLRHEAALGEFDEALRLQPRYTEAHYNRGIALFNLDRLEDAVNAYDRAITLRPNHTSAHYNRGIALEALAQPEEALASYDAAIALAPDTVEIHWNKCLCTLLLGRFAEGWPLYAWRKKQTVPFGLRTFAQPEWTGTEDIHGKTLLVHAEQGLGDTIMFARYIALLENRGANIIVHVQQGLAPSMRALAAKAEIVETIPDAFDAHVPLMDLPRIFATDAHSIPADVPYLHAEPARMEKWRRTIGEEGFRIGIAWQGKAGHMDKGRSFALREFASLARIPHVRLISLQKGDAAEQLRDLPGGMNVETLGEDLDATGGAFLDTAAAMMALDLIVTSDTAIAHLAGALGRPVWLALKHVPEWRWQRERSDSPWYPTMRLFRQKTRGDWARVFADMQTALLAEFAEQLQ